MQPREQREAASERVLPEEQLEHGGLLVAPGLPVSVSHGEVVQVCEQRGQPSPQALLRRRCARCHDPVLELRVAAVRLWVLLCAEISGTCSSPEAPRSLPQPPQVCPQTTLPVTHGRLPVLTGPTLADLEEKQHHVLLRNKPLAPFLAHAGSH